MKELIEHLRRMNLKHTDEAADAIERLENEATAADIRIENDKLEIEALHANRHAREDVISELRDERDKLEADNASLVRDKELDRLAFLAMRDERDEANKNVVLFADDLLYIAGIVEKGRGTKTPDSMKVRDAILGYVQELEASRDQYQQAADSLAASCYTHRNAIGF